MAALAPRTLLVKSRVTDSAKQKPLLSRGFLETGPAQRLTDVRLDVHPQFLDDETFPKAS